jgi:uncharacterized lipoprotein NlpE involved in copper resistance
VIFVVVKKIITVLILTFVLIGCSNHIQSPQVTNKNDIENIPSTIHIKVNNKSVDIPFTSYITIKHFENGTISASTNDHATNKQLTNDNATFILPPSAKVIVDKKIENHPKISVNYFDKQSHKQTSITFPNNSFTLPNQQGQYEYRIVASWHNCRATYTFLVKIK